MRVAISIVFNAERHILDQFKNTDLINKFDKWIFVEGASASVMCTSWCNAMPEEYHKNGSSVDSTREVIADHIQRHPNIELITRPTFWPGKVEMFNEALIDLDSDCQLWEIDIDEYWKANQISATEELVANTKADSAAFHCDYLLTDDIIVRGEWGEGGNYGYRRFWNFKVGEKFISHEPPALSNCNRLLPPKLTPRFVHKSYYYEKDVVFKSKWYGKHENVYEGWKEITTGKQKLPLSVRALFKRDDLPESWLNSIITYR